MGYRVQRRTAKVVFEEGHPLHGAEITTSLSMPTEFVLRFGRDLEAGTDQERVIREWADNYLVEWNLEDEDGQPIPCSGDGAMQVPWDLLVDIITAVAKSTEPEAPLENPSPATTGLEEPSIRTVGA